VVVGSVANFRREKDQGTLLHAFADERFDDAALALVGQGPLESDLRATAEQLDIADRVHFLGYRSDAVTVMAGFDVFTLPSAHEGRPVALMEAMSLGLPVVVTAVGGMVDMVDDGITGLMVPPGNAAALADALATLVQSPTARDTMSAQVQRTAATFDGNVAFDRIEAEYRRLAGEHR
jgi:glycosyltransferase involved in cell wall biosynthesis